MRLPVKKLPDGPVKGAAVDASPGAFEGIACGARRRWMLESFEQEQGGDVVMEEAAAIGAVMKRSPECQVPAALQTAFRLPKGIGPLSAHLSAAVHSKNVQLSLRIPDIKLRMESMCP